MSMTGLSGLEQNQGYVHLYVGDGKGKTTAATGLAVRFLGHGGKVLFCQFLKGRATGEIGRLEALGAAVCRAECGPKFVFQMDDEEKAELKKTHSKCLADAAELAKAGAYQLIVLDEVVDAVNCGAVETEQLLNLIRGRHPSVEVVMSGRNPNQAIMDIADYHTDFVCRKHPYQKGVSSRIGVEY